MPGSCIRPSHATPIFLSITQSVRFRIRQMVRRLLHRAPKHLAQMVIYRSLIKTDDFSTFSCIILHHGSVPFLRFIVCLATTIFTVKRHSRATLKKRKYFTLSRAANSPAPDSQRTHDRDCLGQNLTNGTPRNENLEFRKDEKVLLTPYKNSAFTGPIFLRETTKSLYFSRFFFFPVRHTGTALS